MTMTLEQLRVFIAVAECEHFTRAAEKLNLTQPAVSAAVASLESRYKILLFNRIGRRVELTQLGAMLLKEAHLILKKVGHVESMFKEVAALQRGELRICTTPLLAKYWLPTLLCLFHQQHLHVRIQCMVDDNPQIIKTVVEGNADLGVIEGEPTCDPLTSRALGGDQLVIIVGHKHPWFGRSCIGLHELEQTVWILREEGAVTHQHFAQVLQAHGLDIQKLPVAMEVSSCETIKQIVSSGHGAGIISSLMIEKEIESGQLQSVHPIEIPSLYRQFCLLIHEERYISPVSKSFISLLEKAAA
jgi:DNA-binding transcriptional LysR family regulator